MRLCVALAPRTSFDGGDVQSTWEAPAQIPHRKPARTITAHGMVFDTIPHRFFCPCLHVVARKALSSLGQQAISRSTIRHRKATMSNDENPSFHGSNPCRTANALNRSSSNRNTNSGLGPDDGNSKAVNAVIAYRNGNSSSTHYA